jgi:hypothetical protein
MLPMHVTTGIENVMEFKITTAAALAANAKVTIEFPTFDIDRNIGDYPQMFADDLGTGLKSGQKIGCFAVSPANVVTAEATLSCTLYKGSRTYRTPARVVVTTSTVPSASTIEFAIAGIKNPVWAAGDGGANPFLRAVITDNSTNNAEGWIPHAFAVDTAGPAKPGKTDPVLATCALDATTDKFKLVSFALKDTKYAIWRIKTFDPDTAGVDVFTLKHTTSTLNDIGMKSDTHNVKWFED